MKSEYQKMIAGEPYHPFDPDLRSLAQTARQKQAAFNEEVDPVKGMEIIKGWFGSTGENLMSILDWWWIMVSIFIWEKISIPIGI